jgi:hypothetical protein
MFEVIQLLRDINEVSTRYSRSYYVRHLDPDEPIPQFGHGIPESPLAQRDWIWISYSTKDDTPLAILLAAPVHNLAMLSRIYAKEGAPTSILVGLLRKSLADISNRGYTQYAVFLDKDQPVCMRLYDIATRAGAGELKGTHILVSGPTNIGRM